MSEQLPAWQRETGGELRWPVTVVVLGTALSQLTIPAQFTLGPVWLLPVIEIAALAVLFILNPGAIRLPHLHLRWLSISLTATMTISVMASAVLLISGLLRGTVSNDPLTLIRVGGTIWVINIVLMALWYWELDRGGASARARNVFDRTDFLFPQMSSPQFAAADWEPRFFDYLYTSYTNATAFSPTDVLPLSRWGKLLMMVQSSVSLSMVVLIIARAVNTMR